jgi:hypothetical protein
MNKDAIGGYFSLELNEKPVYHNHAIKLNSGRNSFEYIIIANKYNKIYIPYFTCHVLLQPLLRNNIQYEFYSINENLEPIFDFENIKTDEAFLYTNYFGLKDDFVTKITALYSNLIIDNAQSFFSFPQNNADTFYSPRKFFGIPDGGYVYCKKKIENNFIEDSKSISRFSHLITRLVYGAENGYNEFKENEFTLDNQPPMIMSALTSNLIKNIDFENVAKIRVSNYEYLDFFLASDNLINLKRINQIPLVYPFRTKNKKLRSILLKNRIYTATYWPNIIEWTDPESLENDLLKEIIYLPIDQRYTKLEMEFIVKIILNG